MADKFDLTYENSRWFMDAGWHLRIASLDKSKRGEFSDHGYISEINSVASGRVGEEKDVPLYKIVTVEVRDGAIMEAKRLVLRAKKVYTKAGACNKEFAGCLAKGKNLRETAGIYFSVYSYSI
jgi:hypothetical protein